MAESSITLVTGGAGFIGSHLVELLISRGERVRVLELPGMSVTHLPTDRIEVQFGDIRDRKAVERAVKDCAAVYHLAAIPHLWALPRGLFRRVNFVGAVNVLDAALATGARRILHVSTESILTRSGQVGEITEDQAVTLDDALGPYCRSKLLAERYAFRLAGTGAPVLIANPTIPVGPGDRGRSPPTRMILDFCKGKRKEYLDAELNLIDVRDAAEGLVRVMDRGTFGRRYLLEHENLSVYEVFSRLAKLTGLAAPSRKVPYGLALTAAYVSEFIADLFTKRSPAATITGVRLAARRMHFNAKRSMDELNFQPRPVAEALAEAVTWYREMGWIS